MRVGFSLSSGGLLLPYHLGVLDSLHFNGFLDNATPIAGASAGSIAVATHSCSIDSKRTLDDTIDISRQCQEMGGARGNLLPLLRQKLEANVDADRFQDLQDRTGETVVSYRELFPTWGAVHQTDFEHKEDFIEAVCHSSMFPFFASNSPFALDQRSGGVEVNLWGKQLKLPRLVVDGYFAVPGQRFGCPDFAMADVEVDRTILVSVFPKEVVIGNEINRSEEDNNNIICPDLIDEGMQQSADLLRLATQPTEPKEMMSLYDAGFQDAEKWCRKEQSRSRKAFARKQKKERLWFCDIEKKSGD